MNLNKLHALQAHIDYQFDQVNLLVQALTHKSASVHNNERLEYLGDAILGFVIADLLYSRHPKAKEGELTRRRANLVNGKALAELAKSLELGEYLILGPGEKLSGGFRRTSILANCFEALLGAIYLDKGYEACRRKIMTWFARQIEEDAHSKVMKDAKTDLQEWLQSRKFALPKYTVSDIRGLQHEQTFTVMVTVDGLAHSIVAEGKSRRVAEQEAAKQFLELVRNDA